MGTRSTKGGSAAPSIAPAAASAAPAPASTSAPAPAPVVEKELILLGSSTLPALILIGGKEVQLGTIVAAAHVASGLAVAEWNGLSEEERDLHLNAQVEALQQQADAEAEEAERKRLEEEADDASSDRPYFPRRVLVSNNATIALVEPITGAYIQAGGKAHITLTDPEHAHRVAENLRAVLAQNYLPESVLTVEDAPE